MLTYKIHIIRHGLTQANLEGRYIGSTDLPLCAQGRQALEQLAQTCDYPGVQRVYTSPLLRARESAEILFPEHIPIPLDDLREFEFGAFEGKTMHELENDPAFAAWISGPPSTCAPGGESGEALQTRASNAIAHIFSHMMQQRITSVAVVTHAGIITTLLASMGLPEREAVRWNVQPGNGYTLLLSTQMWMRDHKFEVYEQIPYKREEEDEREPLSWEAQPDDL